MPVFEPHNYSRREALHLLLGAGVTAVGLLAAPNFALADAQADLEKTEAELADAQARLDEVQAQLDEIAAEYEALSIEQDHTLTDIENTNAAIAELQAAIDAKQAELEAKQEALGNRVAAAYKSGPTSWLDVLLSAHSFEELTSGIHYLDSISRSERALIDDVRDAKAELEQQRAELEQRLAELEDLKAQQQAQLEEMQANQARVQEIYDGLDDEVRELMVRRDEELEAARQEAARAAAERAAAAAAAAAGSSSGGTAYTQVTGTLSGATASGSAARVVNSCYSTPSPGAGLCAGWVTQVFQNAGFGWIGGNANDQYNAWCGSSDRGYLQPGMIIAVSSHPHTSAGRIYGHVGIYVGGGTVMDNIGYIRSCSVDYWIGFYGQTVVPRWGWFGGIVLS